MKSSHLERSARAFGYLEGAVRRFLDGEMGQKELREHLSKAEAIFDGQ